MIRKQAEEFSGNRRREFTYRGFDFTGRRSKIPSSRSTPLPTKSSNSGPPQASLAISVLRGETAVQLMRRLLLRAGGCPRHDELLLDLFLYHLKPPFGANSTILESFNLSL
jgi:hypothetical protein